MKKIENKAFTLIETMVALVIGMIAISAMYFSYQYFNNAHQSITDRAKISELGRNSLSMIAKDLKNAGYKNINYSSITDINELNNHIVSAVRESVEKVCPPKT